VSLFDKISAGAQPSHPGAFVCGNVTAALASLPPFPKGDRGGFEPLTRSNPTWPPFGKGGNRHTPRRLAPPPLFLEGSKNTSPHPSAKSQPCVGARCTVPNPGRTQGSPLRQRRSLSIKPGILRFPSPFPKGGSRGIRAVNSIKSPLPPFGKGGNYRPPLIYFSNGPSTGRPLAALWLRLASAEKSPQRNTFIPRARAMAALAMAIELALSGSGA